jgi:hypothetical protein
MSVRPPIPSASIGKLQRQGQRQWAVIAVLVLIVTVLLLAGCADNPDPLVVSGNGKCHPSADLPAHKELSKVPVADTAIDTLFDLLGMERKDHAADDRDYNSLYDQCVDKGVPGTAPKA